MTGIRQNDISATTKCWLCSNNIKYGNTQILAISAKVLPLRFYETSSWPHKTNFLVLKFWDDYELTIW